MLNKVAIRVQFTYEMQRICKEAKEELGYNPSKFLQMISEDGALETAMKLIHKSELSDGFVFLFEKGRTDLTMESVVLKEKYRSLFTDEERNICKARLGLLDMG